VRDEASRTFIRKFSESSNKEVAKTLKALATEAGKALDNEGIPKGDQTVSYQVDIRYSGQGLQLTVDIEIADFEARGLEVIGERFDEMHRQLFTFALPHEKELVNLRAVAQGKPTNVRAQVARAPQVPPWPATPFLWMAGTRKRLSTIVPSSAPAMPFRAQPLCWRWTPPP
jgi:N-methylhydantoinase A